MYRSLACSLLLLIFSSAAYACTCATSVGKSDRELVDEAKAGADAVFIGRVLKIVKNRNRRGIPIGGYKAVFEVREIWKGKQENQIRIFFSNQCCLCDFSFRKGKEYLVYASGDSDQYLSASTCGRTTDTTDRNVDVDRKHLGPSRRITIKDKR